VRAHISVLIYLLDVFQDDFRHSSLPLYFIL
jgi:hypothetical protein